MLASIASVEGVFDFDQASVELFRQASNALGRRYGASGVSLDQGFLEMVEACNRKFNTRANKLDLDAEADESELLNPYYRAKQEL